MYLSFDLVLRVLAFVCFVLATFGVPARVNLVALGLALLTISMIV